MFPQLYLIESKSVPLFKIIQSKQGDQTISLEYVEILAYSGGQVDLGLQYPIIFDLRSTKSAPSVPLLADHNPLTIVGHTETVTISPTNITVVGPLSGTGEKANEIKNNFKNKFPYQASVGIVSEGLRFIPEGKSEVINGQSAIGPIYIAENNLLREVSILSLGADPNTLAKLVASFYKGMKMPTFEEWVKSLQFDPATLTPEQLAALQTVYDELSAAKTNGNLTNEQQVSANARAKALVQALMPKKKIDPPVVPPTLPNGSNNLPNPQDILEKVRSTYVAEQERLDSIKLLQAKYNDPKNNEGKSIFVLAIKDGWGVDKTHLEMLQAARPNVKSGHSNDDTHGTMTLLAAAVCQSAKLKNIEKKYSAPVLEAAHKRYKGRMGLQQLILEAAYANGYEGSALSFKAELKNILRAAFSTFDLPNILSQIVNSYLLEGYMNVDQSWREIARVTSATDFKEFESYRMTGGFTFEKIAKDGKIPHAHVDETVFANKVDTYAKMFAVTRQDIYNDSLGALTDIPRMIGRGGATGFNRAFWTEFMNNAAFFAAGNNNVSTGALGITGLNAANAVFRKIKDPDGEYVQATAAILLVPGELEPTAMSLYGDTNIVSGVTTAGGIPNGNPVKGKYRPVSSPYLSDSTITGNSTTAYYLLADPNDIPAIEAAFLDGNETPIVETADVDFNQLGIQMRGYWDWGVRKQDYRAGVRSTGV